jgi:hypothetical protein
MAKRQIPEVIVALAPSIDKLMNQVFKLFDKEAEESFSTRQVNGKATHFACIDQEKRVDPDFFAGFLMDRCNETTVAEEGSLVNSNYPEAMMSQGWDRKQGSEDGDAREGDWVTLEMAW